MKSWVESLDPNIISVIIPTFNRENFLSACIESLKKSDKALQLDIIVIDDKSDDYNAANNIKICDNAKQSGAFYNVRLIQLHENTGTVSIPRNIGISHAVGRTIAPTDDDCMPRNKKFDLFPLLWEKESTVLAYGDRDEYSLDINGDFQFYRTVKCSQYVNDKKSVGIDNGQFIYKADNYINVPPIFPINACDWELYSRFAEYGDFAYLPLSVCRYYWHNTNISRIPKNMRVNPLKVLPKFMDYFKDGEFKNACASLLST